MQATIVQTREAINDVIRLAEYIIDEFYNDIAANRFLGWLPIWLPNGGEDARNSFLC